MKWACGRVSEVDEDFKSRMIFRVGNEKKVKFWMDK